MSGFNDIFSKELSTEQRQLLAKMMANLAAADGQIDHFESNFLESFLGSFIKGDFAKGIESMDLVTDEEISSGCGNGAEQMFTLCALMAFVDEHLDSTETKLLLRYGKAMDLSSSRVEELMTIARRQLLHQSAEAISELPGFSEEKFKALQSLGEKVAASAEELENIAREHKLIP
jgi:hypothetical protein